MDRPPMECDQAVYAPANISGRKGYQIVAKSSGVSADESQFIESHGLPLSLDPNDFKEARRMLRLPSGRLGFNLLKSIGTAYDGRGGAVYSQFVIVDEPAFLSAGADIGLIEQAYRLSDASSNKAEQIRLPASTPAEIDFVPVTTVLKSKSALARMVSELSSGRRIVVPSQQTDEGLSFIRNFLMLLPKSMRAVTYTTYAAQPYGEALFSIVFAPQAYLAQTPPDGYVMIDPSRTDQTGQGGGVDYAEYLAEMAFGKAHRELEEFQAVCEGYPKDLDMKSRLAYAHDELQFAGPLQPREKAVLALKLAANGLTRQKKAQYFPEARKLVEEISDAALLEDYYLKSLAYQQALSDSAAYDELLRDGLLSLAKTRPESAYDFAMQLLGSSKDSRKAVLAKTMIETLENSQGPARLVLEDLIRDPELHNLWIGYLRGLDPESILAGISVSTAKKATSHQKIVLAFDERAPQDLVAYSDFVKNSMASQSFQTFGQEERLAAIQAIAIHFDEIVKRAASGFLRRTIAIESADQLRLLETPAQEILFPTLRLIHQLYDQSIDKDERKRLQKLHSSLLGTYTALLEGVRLESQ